MVFTGEETAAGHGVQQRSGITPRDVDTFMFPTGVGPADGEPVRRVLTRQTEHRRKPLRSNPFEPDQTDPSDRVAAVELRQELRWQLRLRHIRINPEVDEKPSPDDAVYVREAHFGDYGPNRRGTEMLHCYASRRHTLIR